MLGQYQPLRTYHLPSIVTVPIPNLEVSVDEKALESLDSATSQLSTDAF
jgi:hypothetical protein